MEPKQEQKSGCLWLVIIGIVVFFILCGLAGRNNSTTAATPASPATAHSSAALTYLDQLRDRAQAVDEAMIGITSLAGISATFRREQAGEAREYQQYIGSGQYDREIADIHDQFQASLDQMRLGAETSDPRQVERGTEMFRSCLQMAIARVKHY